MLYDWPLNRRVVPRLVWASSTGANKPTLERLRRPRPPHVNWLVSSTTCLKTSSPTKNLTRPATNYDSKNPPSVNSKGRPLLWAIHCCQPPRFPHNSPVHIFKFLRRLGLKCAAPPFRPPDIHGRPIPCRKIVPERSIPALQNQRANAREQTTRVQRPRRRPLKAESPKAGDRTRFRHKSSSRNFFG